MAKIIKFLFMIGLRRWEALSVISIVLFFLLIKYAFYPAASYQWKRFKGIISQIKFIKTADILPIKSASISKKTDKLDSLIHVAEKQIDFSEPLVLEKIYELSDSSGCTVSKVQIGEPIDIGTGFEIPVFLNGDGTYSAIGAFISGIENCDYAARVRQLTMKNIGRGNITIFLDYVIMKSK